MLKKTFYGFVVLAMVLNIAIVPNMILAKSGDNYTLPEDEGVYDVPGRPDLKLKVFVYREKDGAGEKAVNAGKVALASPTLACGSTSTVDPDSVSVVSAAGWKLPSIWTYRVNFSSVPATIGADNAQTLITNAYNTWAGVVGSKVTFSQGGDTYTAAARFDGQNIVAWGRTSGTALAVTYTWYNSSGVAVEIDTIMNKKFTWYWSNPATWTAGQTCAYQGVYDVQDILTHELGHTVGLGDKYTGEFVNNTMYGYGSKGETKKDTLTTGDIAGVQAIYGL